MKTLQQLREAFHRTFGGWIYMDPASVWSWFEPHLSTPGTTEVDEWIKQLEMSFKQQFAYHHADDKGNHPMLPQYSAEEVFTWFYLHIKSRIQLSPSMQIGEVSEGEILELAYNISNDRFPQLDYSHADHDSYYDGCVHGIEAILTKLTKTQE